MTRRGRRGGEGRGPVEALISLGLRQLLPALKEGKSSIFADTWAICYRAGTIFFCSSRHVTATDRISEFGMAYAAPSIIPAPVPAKINSLHYRVSGVIYAADFSRRWPMNPPAADISRSSQFIVYLPFIRDNVRSAISQTKTEKEKNIYGSNRARVVSVARSTC